VGLFQSPGYLWWVDQVEGMVQPEVDEAQQSGVQLGERGHDSVVNISWMLRGKENRVNQVVG